MLFAIGTTMNKTIIQKITPHLWFDNNAGEAARFYTSIFKNSKIKNVTTLHNTPSGTVEIFTVELLGQEFTLINAGPLFKFNPSVSFLVPRITKEEVDSSWKELSRGGTVLMELAEYPFSERYGWTQDKYGVSWQVMLMGGGGEGEQKIKQRIIPTLMFVGKQSGKGEEPDKEGTVKHAAFILEGQEFAAMDSARGHKFAFNEAISLMVHCETQNEIDRYWEKLSADPKAEQCGWLKDKYGLSWQIVPNLMDEMLTEDNDRNKNKIARVTEAFLQMKKLDITKLKMAYESG